MACFLLARRKLKEHCASQRILKTKLGRALDRGQDPHHGFQDKGLKMAQMHQQDSVDVQALVHALLTRQRKSGIGQLREIEAACPIA